MRDAEYERLKGLLEDARTCMSAVEKGMEALQARLDNAEGRAVRLERQLRTSGRRT